MPLTDRSTEAIQEAPNRLTDWSYQTPQKSSEVDREIAERPQQGNNIVPVQTHWLDLVRQPQRESPDDFRRVVIDSEVALRLNGLHFLLLLKGAAVSHRGITGRMTGDRGRGNEVKQGKKPCAEATGLSLLRGRLPRDQAADLHP